MELSDEKILEYLLHEWEKESIRKNPVRELHLQASVRSQRKLAARRCECGTCPKCLENARWERIFRDKFADPDYYSRRAISHLSPLSDS